MADFIAPFAYAALVWWFTTGVILFLDGLPQRSFRWSLSGATILMLLGVYIVLSGTDDNSPRGAYVGFTGAILIWGWLEMSFLMGFVTGLAPPATLKPASGWRHFVRATQAIIYNEIATLLGGAVLYLACRHAPNQTALWTYVILWSMRISAKLNLFLGVPNLGEQFLPPHLEYLKLFFRKRPMNLLFPVSVTASTLALGFLLHNYFVATDAFQATRVALLACLLGLALLEHWFMVIPLPSERLWTWAAKSQPKRREDSDNSAFVKIP